MKANTIDRTINYFSLDVKLSKGKQLSDFHDVFEKVINLSKTGSPKRFVHNGAKTLYISDIKFDTKRLSISGKLLNIRTDAWPEKMNMSSDKISEIEGGEEDGIIESTHFILSYAKGSVVVAFEFNQYGPRISDFNYYILGFLKTQQVAKSLSFNPIIRDDLEDYKRRINNVSQLIAKVHKDDIKRINKVDSELFDAFETASKVSQAEYVTLQFKFEIDSRPSQTYKTKVSRMIDIFRKKAETLGIFTTLKVKAEDEDRNNRLKDFDLLNIWVKSEIKVSKRPTSKVIISSEMFEKMKIELAKEFRGR